MLQAKVERVIRDALQTPLKEHTRIALYDVAKCNRQDPQALLIPTPGKRHVFSPNCRGPSLKHPDYLDVLGSTVRESELDDLDKNTPQRERRIVAEFALLETRTKEDARYASSARSSSNDVRRRHHHFTEMGFSRAHNRLQSLNRSTGTKKRLRRAGQLLHDRHRSTGHMNGFPVKNLVF